MLHDISYFFLTGIGLLGNILLIPVLTRSKFFKNHPANVYVLSLNVADIGNHRTPSQIVWGHKLGTIMAPFDHAVTSHKKVRPFGRTKRRRIVSDVNNNAADLPRMVFDNVAYPLNQPEFPNL